MRLAVLDNVDDVVARQLCCGCGACAAVDPDGIEMIDVVDHGRRPRRRTRGARTAGGRGTSRDEALDRAAMSVCPGVGLTHTDDRRDPALIETLRAGWGPVLEVWEAHATDDAIRHAGSSGGAASAIALACIERGGMHGVLHIKARPDVPYLNHTVLSTTRDEVLDATGSRYAPASPCDGLGRVESAPAPCVFIGKPCDVAAVRKAQAVRPALRDQVGVAIAFFCAGTPTTRATLRLLERLGIDDPRALTSLRYRGHGWPGPTAATVRRGGATETRTTTYEDAWGELTNDKQWRCHVRADHTGEFADIAVGDPWDRTIEPGDPGRSLVLVRTERGRQVLRQAIDAGYLSARRTDPARLPAAQPNLLRGRGAVWGRLLACRLLGVPAPRYRGFPMFRYWCTTLTMNEKIRSIAGTARRVLTRRLRRRATIEAFRPRAHPASGCMET